MALHRDEFNKLVIRLGIIRDTMTDAGFTETARALVDVITGLNNVDQTYICELASRKQARNI